MKRYKKVKRKQHEIIKTVKITKKKKREKKNKEKSIENDKGKENHKEALRVVPCFCFSKLKALDTD